MHKDVAHLIEVYQQSLLTYGATPKGLLWPDGADLATRFQVLLAPVLASAQPSGRRQRLLDLGCGPGLLLDYLAANGSIDAVDYVGVDVCPEALRLASARWPGYRFEQRDLRDTPFEAGSFDYAVACGVFTGRLGLGHDEMEAMLCGTLRAVWPSVRTGLSFNVMSKHVDWEREDLFHWPLDTAMTFCKEHLSRHVAFGLDYGLWEMAIHVRRMPLERLGDVPIGWSSGDGGNGA